MMKLISNGAILKDDLATLDRYGLVDLHAYEDVNNTGKKGDGEEKNFWESWSFGGMGKKSTRKAIPKLILIGNTKQSIQESQEAMWARRKIPVEEEAKVEEKAPDTEEEVKVKIGALLGTHIAVVGEVGGENKKESKMVVLRRGVEELEERIRSGDSPATPGSYAPTTSSEVTQSTSTSTTAPDVPPPKLIAPHLLAAQLSESLIQLLLALDSVTIQSTYSDARKERKEGVRVVQELLDRVDKVKDDLKKANKKAGL
jgi:hypothetical protein